MYISANFRQDKNLGAKLHGLYAGFIINFIQKMSSPIYISEDDDSFDTPFVKDRPKRIPHISISDDEDEENPQRLDVEVKSQSEIISDDEEVPSQNLEMNKRRHALIKNLFPNVKSDGSGSSKSRVIDPIPPAEKQPGFVKVMGGVSVHLPVNPYPCQVAVMFKVS